MLNLKPYNSYKWHYICFLSNSSFPDCSISQVSISERKANNAQIATAMKYFDSYFTCLEQALEPDNMKLYTDVTELPLEQFAKDSEIYKLFQTVTTLSSRQYLLQTLRWENQKLMYHMYLLM